MMENKIISVERMLQYASVPSEPALFIDSNRPTNHWPSQGEVDIRGLQVKFILVDHHGDEKCVSGEVIVNVFINVFRSGMLHICPLCYEVSHVLSLEEGKLELWGGLVVGNLHLYRPSFALLNQLMDKY